LVNAKRVNRVNLMSLTGHQGEGYVEGGKGGIKTCEGWTTAPGAQKSEDSLRLYSESYDQDIPFIPKFISSVVELGEKRS